MRICLANDIFPPVMDGVSNTVFNYANILEKKYGDVIVATPYYPDAADDYAYEVVRYKSVDTTEMVGYRAGFPFSQAAMERLTAFAPDIIHTHCPMASTYLARELREMTDVPVVFTYHTKFDIDIARAVKSKLLREPAVKAIIENIEACDEVWAVNEGAGKNLKSLGYGGDYIVMPNGVDIGRTPADPALVKKVNEENGLSAEIPVFLFVGRMMWYKGLKIILDGLATMKDRGVKFKMIFVGGGEEFDEIRNYADKKRLHDECFFKGPVYDREELKAYYSRADMFLLPSVFDNNPLVVKEAAACGTASLLIRDSSSAEGVKNGENGILIGENPDELSSELTALCKNREKMKEIGEKAGDTLYMSWEDSIAVAEKRYREVIRNYRSGKKKNGRAKLDGLVNRIADISKDIMRAKVFANDIKSEIREHFMDSIHGYADVGAWLRLKNKEAKDWFGRYE